MDDEYQHWQRESIVKRILFPRRTETFHVLVTAFHHSRIYISYPYLMQQYEGKPNTHYYNMCNCLAEQERHYRDECHRHYEYSELHYYLKIVRLHGTLANELRVERYCLFVEHSHLEEHAVFGSSCKQSISHQHEQSALTCKYCWKHQKKWHDK